VPIHEFACQDCGHRFEDLILGSEIPVCPRCESTRLEKLLSTFAVNSPGSAGSLGDLPPGCGTCGDPRGPGACSMN
jgi:putative FmdB family regulatory protein